MSDLRTSDAWRRSMRAYLEARDGRVCRRCGHEIPRGQVAEIGHVISRAMGGSDAPSNLALEHGSCNRKAGSELDRKPSYLPAIRERIVRFESRSAREGVSSLAAHVPYGGPAASNGARSGPISRTVVLFRRIVRSS